jgi:hypothetical protein
MMDDWAGFWTIVAFLAGCVVGAWAAIRECANASLHGGRAWWKTAIFCAQHRISLRQFKRDQERGYTGSSWDADELERHVK